MTALVLISHGAFCKGIKQSAEMILGPQSEIYTVSLEEGESPEQFENKFLDVIEQLDEYVVFADLLGGTACNVAAKQLSNNPNKFPLYTGMNLPMVVSFVNGKISSQTPDILKESKDGIVKVNDALIQAESEATEDF